MDNSASRRRAMLVLSVLLASALEGRLLSSQAACADVLSSQGQQETVRIDLRGQRRWRVKEIFIIGNLCTMQSFILDQLPFKPGDRFAITDLWLAEERLSRFHSLFMVDRKAGLPPRVRMLDEEEDDEPYKDIMIYLTETPAARYLWASIDVGCLAATSLHQGLPAAIAEACGDHGYMPLFALESMIADLQELFQRARIRIKENGGTGYRPEPALLP